jgi:hypothetical protein
MFWAILFGFVVVAFASGWCLLKGRHGIAICLALLMAGGAMALVAEMLVPFAK